MALGTESGGQSRDSADQQINDERQYQHRSDDL